MDSAEDVRLPRNIAWELAHLKTIDPVREDTVRYEVDADGTAIISFDIETDILLEPEETPIRDVEPIEFHYPSAELVGHNAPNVFSARMDFPRNLQHLNPASANELAWLCLARSGLQQIYNTDGIAGVVTRLVKWLNDAKIGTLYEDGWEPVPGRSYDECVIGSINAAGLQEHAREHPDGGSVFICARLAHSQGENPFVQADAGVIELANSEQVKSARCRMQMNSDKNEPFRTAIPAVFCWPGRDRIETDPYFNQWRDMPSLRQGLVDTGLYDEIEKAFELIELCFWDPDQVGPHPEIDHSGSPGIPDKKAILLIVGLWRPIRMDETIVGLSKNPSARELELRVLYLERPAAADRWSNETRVRDFFELTPVSSDLLEAVAGEPHLPPTAFMGAGALGSAMVGHALRGGAKKIIVFDRDRLLPHNLARHLGFAFDICENKASVIYNHARALATNATVEPHTEDISRLDDKELSEYLEGASLIVDATADPLVRRRLARFKSVDLPVIRSEIFHKGRLGVSLMTRTGSPVSLNCLFYQLLRLSHGHKAIQGWLAYEASRTFKDEELLIGFGCSSQTTRHSSYKVDAHAACAFALARNWVNQTAGARIGLHTMNEDGTTKSTEVIEADTVKVFEEKDDTNGWRVIVTTGVIEWIRYLRDHSAPNETGGYLFGGIDETASEIYVVAASPQPPATKASPTSLELGPWGRTGFEEMMLRRSCGRLPPVGAWHSHPGGDATASARDWATVARFKENDKRYGLPTLMAITGQNGERVYVAAD